MTINIIDIRHKMPNYEIYKDVSRSTQILGIAIHHSNTLNKLTAELEGDGISLFNHQVKECGWLHGKYHYVILGNGLIQYTLDETIVAPHAGFKDPSNLLNLEQGQYWNNYYLAICLIGSFNYNRVYCNQQGVHPIPNHHIHPSQAQYQSLLSLLQQLMEKHQIPAKNIRGHRELAGNYTQCPGLNLDIAQIRQQLLPQNAGPPATFPTLKPGQHVIFVPDQQEYFNAALGYIWKFQPDVSFYPYRVNTRWATIIAVGNIDPTLLAEYQHQGAKLVQHILGDPLTVQKTLDQLVAQGTPFLPILSEKD